MLSFWTVENKDIYMCTELGATLRTRKRQIICLDKGRELGRQLVRPNLLFYAEAGAKGKDIRMKYADKNSDASTLMVNTAAFLKP